MYFLRQKKEVTIKEKIIPKIFEKLSSNESFYQADYKDLEDLKELLNLSYKNTKNLSLSPWEKVKPLYPISPTN